METDGGTAATITGSIVGIPVELKLKGSYTNMELIKMLMVPEQI
ncbi:MAG: hypothetical protein CM15mP96_1710 [Gammaproteobacteria bacterium]|nr:MAG: hypothetical protein CM15mP96_1710 [Gammaproteobacteria bacterium]